MHLCAQDVVTIVPQNVNTVEGTLGTGNGASDRILCSWTSNDSYDVDGNHLVIDCNGTLDDAITEYTYSPGWFKPDVKTTFLNFGVSNQVLGENIVIRIFAPYGWVVEGYDFTALRNGAVSTVDIIEEGDDEGTTVGGNDVPFSKHSLNKSVVKLVLHSNVIIKANVVFKNFIVSLKKVDTPAEPINSVDESTITTGTTDEDKVRHWAWKQEVPVQGKSYKIVNGALMDDGSLVVVGQKNNETISGKDDGVQIADNIEKGGEWLYGSDYTLTNYTDEVVGFYESHLREWNIGFNESTEWRLSPLAIDGVAGFAISNKSQLVTELSRSYLKISEYFSHATDIGNIKMGTLGWEQDERDFKLLGLANVVPVEKPDNILKSMFIWNFYSLDQYKCYIAYKDAYNDFMALADIVDDPENAGVKEETYYQKYLDLLDEIEHNPAQGYDEETRAATYDRIRRMLDLIATIKIDYGTEDSGTQVGLVNHDAEAVGGTTGWSTSTVSGPTGSFSATEGGRDGSAHKFELSNLRMYQEVKADPKNSFILEPGVYYASVYWKASAGDKFMFEVVGEFDKQSTGELVGEGLDGEWKYALLELVVVTDTRITISATHKGDGQAYIDDFDLRRFCQNYYRDDAATKTRVYKGLFNTKYASKTSTLTNDEEKDKAGINITKFLDLGPIASVTEEYPYADITKLAFYSKIQFDNTENPNGLVYANPYRVNVKGTTNAANNVIIAGEDGLECEKLVLQNGYPYSTKWTFTANDAEYTMNAFGVGIDDTKGKVAYGTLILPYDVDANTITANGVEVYKPTAIDAKGHLTLQKSTTISADVPYIVKYTDADAQTKLFNAFSTFKTVKPCGMVVDGDLLVGTYEKTKVPYADGNCYLLQLQNGKLAFYPVKKDGLYCNPFRCYLKLPAGTNPSKVSFVFEDDETTGVTEIENAICADEIYDLSGRRVENMTRPGVYVKNGKKVLVK